jgi:hypothetical protein
MGKTRMNHCSHSPWLWVALSGVIVACLDETRVIDRRNVNAEPAPGGGASSPDPVTTEDAFLMPPNGAPAGDVGAPTGDGTADPPTPPLGDEPVLATLVRVQNPEGRSHYLNLYRSLPADGNIDRATGVEFSGRAQAAIFNGAIYVFDLDNTAVTRWTVDDALRPIEQETVSFANTGLTVACQICNAFLSEERAFIQNAWSGTLVEWNPTTMLISQTVPLPESALARDGMDGEFIWPLVTGERVIFAAGWADYEGIRFGDTAAVAMIDGSREAASLEVVEDGRCGVNSGIQPFADAEGRVYAGGNWYSGWHQVGTPELAPNPACLLRLQAGAAAFDPDYYVDLLAATSSRAVSSARGMGDGKMLLNVWPESAPAPSLEQRQEDPQAFWDALVWTYVILDVETLELTPVDIPPAGAGNQTPLTLEGDTLVQVYEDGRTTNQRGATLYRVNPDGSVQRLLAAGTGGDFAMVSRLR